MMLSEAARAEIRKWMDLYPAGRQRSASCPRSTSSSANSATAPSRRRTNWRRCWIWNRPRWAGWWASTICSTTEPKGEYHIEVCTNVPCMVRGANRACITWKRSWAFTTAKQPPTTSSRSTTWNVSARAARRRWWRSPSARAAGSAISRSCDSAEDVEKLLDLLASGKAFATLERWTPSGDPESTGKAAGPYRMGGMETPC